MANICETTIAVVGLKEAPETFIKAFAKAMFAIDLDNLEPKEWGEDNSVDGKTWYDSLANEYRQCRYAVRYRILYPCEPYNRLGVAAPRFYCTTKWEPPVKEIREASKAFPGLTFHSEWWVEQDGPSGQLVIRNGEDIDAICRPASGYLFDHALLYPTVSLLPAHLPYTLAQRAALRLEDTIDTVREFRRILDERSFTSSPCQAYRDQEKVKQTRQALDGLLEQMQTAAKQLTFEGVFINDSRCRTFYDHDKESPGAPVGDYERRADEAQTAEAEPKAGHEEQVTARSGEEPS